MLVELVARRRRSRGTCVDHLEWVCSYVLTAAAAVLPVSTACAVPAAVCEQEKETRLPHSETQGNRERGQRWANRRLMTARTKQAGMVYTVHDKDGYCADE